MAGKLEFIFTTHKINTVVTLTPGIARFVGIALAKGMSDQVPAPTNIDHRGAGISCT